MQLYELFPIACSCFVIHVVHFFFSPITNYNQCLHDQSGIYNYHKRSLLWLATFESYDKVVFCSTFELILVL